MKRTMSGLLVLLILLPLLTVGASAETINFSAYNLDTLIQIRMELNRVIAEKQVAQTSTMSPNQSHNGEILFRNIPWGSNADAVKEKLVADGMIDSSHDLDNDDYIYAWSLTEDMPIQSNAGTNIAVFKLPTSFKVAGYPLSQVQIYCPYGYTPSMVDRTIAGTKFNLAQLKFEVSDIELVFADLTNKLSSLYGTPETVEDDNSYMVFGDSPDFTQYNTWNVWYGSNSTGVFLYKTYRIEKGSTEIKRPELTLVYGKTDGREYLNGLSQAVENEKKQQDLLIQQQNADNVDGL